MGSYCKTPKGQDDATFFNTNAVSASTQWKSWKDNSASASTSAENVEALRCGELLSGFAVCYTCQSGSSLLISICQPRRQKQSKLVWG